VRTALNWLMRDLVVNFCEDGDEPSDSIMSGNFLPVW